MLHQHSTDGNILRMALDKYLSIAEGNAQNRSYAMILEEAMIEPAPVSPTPEALSKALAGLLWDDLPGVLGFADVTPCFMARLDGRGFIDACRWRPSTALPLFPDLPPAWTRDFSGNASVSPEQIDLAAHAVMNTLSTYGLTLVRVTRPEDVCIEALNSLQDGLGDRIVMNLGSDVIDMVADILIGLTIPWRPCDTICLSDSDGKPGVSFGPSPW